MTSAARAVPFALPDVGNDEIEAVAQAMRSGWVTTGPRTHEFEAAFADALGGGLEAVALNSATAGLHLGLEALGVGPQDEVLLPAWTFTATAEVVRYLGAEPIFVDVDPSTLCVDLDRAASLVTRRTKAFMPVHFAGLPIDSSALADWGAAHPGVHIVEDAAHAFPAASRGISVGAFATTAAVFSFYATKTITTGEGGMLVTGDARIAERARRMRLHGIDRDAFHRYRSEVPAWRYDVIAAGFKYNMTDTAAALGLVQLKRAQMMRDRRAEIARFYSESFKDLNIELPASGPDDSIHAWHLYVIRLEQMARDPFIDALALEGVGTSVHFIPLHQLTYWRGVNSSANETALPVSTEQAGRVVSLPIYSRMSDFDVEHVVESVRKVRSQ